MIRQWTIERMTAFLKRAHIDPNGYGERLVEPEIPREELVAIIEADKRERWPRIQEEMDARK